MSIGVWTNMVAVDWTILHYKCIKQPTEAWMYEHAMLLLTVHWKREHRNYFCSINEIFLGIQETMAESSLSGGDNA
jgi:hypothetical protein